MFFIIHNRGIAALFLLIRVLPEAEFKLPGGLRRKYGFNWEWNSALDQSTPFATRAEALALRAQALEFNHWSLVLYDSTEVVGQAEATLIQVMQS